MFEIELTSKFKERHQKLTQKNKELVPSIDKALRNLRENPFHKSLRTHKIYNSSFGTVYSSFVSGDLRILWIQKDNTCILLLLDLGGHSGKNSVYS